MREGARLLRRWSRVGRGGQSEQLFDQLDGMRQHRVRAVVGAVSGECGFWAIDLKGVHFR
jgi:hypothetical protein